MSHALIHLSTYRMQKVANSRTVDGVLISHVLQLFNGFPDCLRTTHDKLCCDFLMAFVLLMCSWCK